MDPRQRRRRGDHPKRGRPQSSDFSQLALWMAANLAGMVTAVLLLRASFFQTLLKRVGRGKSSARKPTREQSLPMLAESIIGSSKSMIESVLGPPRSAVLEGIGVVVRPKLAFWHSNTWYYPVPRNGPMAMAINFSQDLAMRVEFFTAV